MAERLTIERRDGLGLAAVMARKGVATEAIGTALGLPLADAPALVFGNGLRAVGTGPGSWLVIGEDAPEDFADSIAGRLGGLASVSDQSSGYVVHRLGGGGARRLLQRGLAIDLHPDVFRAGSAATSLIAHIGVILWQTDDTPRYEIATFRSYAGSFRHWLDATAAAL